MVGSLPGHYGNFAYRLDFFQDWDVGVGPLPHAEKILVRGTGLRGIPLHGISPGKTHSRQCSEWTVHDGAPNGRYISEIWR
jgi:hypothetical protein